jgi:hypothetical protein
MKILILLMIACSIVVGIPTSLGFISLFGIEFLGPISIIKTGHYSLLMLIAWGGLILTHLALISLFFMTKKSYFKQLLLWIPLGFVILFAVFELLSLILFLPFLIVWVIALLKQRSRTKLALK